MILEAPKMPTDLNDSFSRMINQKIKIDEVFNFQSENIHSSLEEVDKFIRNKAPNVAIHFKYDKAKGDGKETPFQPLGRLLLSAKKRGIIKKCIPSSDGDGFFVLI
tara:strand:+ start:2609 stop:2926 length:318 start_codon:yes stop_codon:yes gene_type:complete